jgi:aspartate/methionine/tyrosine aminotransferase
VVEYPVGPWAREQFGELAGHVCAALVGALHQALTDAQNAQKEGKSRKLFTFGSTQATRRYECIVEALKEMDGVQIIKPSGSPHELVVLDGKLIYPFRYAKDSSTPIHRAGLPRKRSVS